MAIYRLYLTSRKGNIFFFRLGGEVLPRGGRSQMTFTLFNSHLEKGDHPKWCIRTNFESPRELGVTRFIRNPSFDYTYIYLKQYTLPFFFIKNSRRKCFLPLRPAPPPVIEFDGKERHFGRRFFVGLV